MGKDSDSGMSIEQQIITFITKNAPSNGVVLGVSGGIDSAVVLSLCVRALGKDRTRALFMPVSASDVSETITRYVEQLGCPSELLPIGPLFDAYVAHGSIAVDNHLVSGNLKARIRMNLLYTRSNARGLVVMGTGNRSELLAGYFTKYGDGGVDYLPIGDLYKTDVRELARNIGIPQPIINQPPSAGLWDGQTDEQELGITYEKLDKILVEYADNGVPFASINLPGISKADVELVQNRVRTNEFKSLAPPICVVTR